MSRISIYLLNGGWTDLLVGVALGWISSGAFYCVMALVRNKPKDQHA